MSFDVDVSRTLGEAHVGATFATQGGLTVLSGVSGAGKTSVLNMVAGLLRPDSGHVRVDGITLFDAAARIDLPPHKRRLGYVFQDGRLFPHRRVRANLLYGHHLAEPEDRWITLDDVVGILGIGALLDRWPRSLSGGEAQRVAIGRALLSGARALLMDEPLASLDPERRAEIMAMILRIRDELALPILYVTHDPAEADRLANDRVEISRRP
ncbi:ATP-binding cassette domain-containing protein [Sphingobium sp. H39-3-25]|uniref:ATP-binding cassette domain-containing protein n=1 Tax=Sphingobium arseniciresistens TaxID=3030834 RepID=UPI0023B9676B|nr:ATP-binding cassette domain-containing protein [Sphingobium arseniciresistens]